MKPIWYFVGLILLTMGGIVFLSGIYSLFVPPERIVALSALHTNLWWGVVMILAGVLFLVMNRNKKSM